MRWPRAALLLAAGLAAGCGGGFALSVGDCATVDGDADPVTGLGEVTIVDCDEPHDLEVVHTFELARDQVAGDARVAAIAEACLGEAFTAYVGEPADASPLQLLPIPPTAAAVERGDREVVCTVRDRDGQRTTGSVRAGSSPA